jgi:hypothetical protein
MLPAMAIAVEVGAMVSNYRRIEGVGLAVVTGPAREKHSASREAGVCVRRQGL